MRTHDKPSSAYTNQTLINTIYYHRTHPPTALRVDVLFLHPAARVSYAQHARSKPRDKPSSSLPQKIRHACP